jgi:hypothetical protein
VTHFIKPIKRLEKKYKIKEKLKKYPFGAAIVTVLYKAYMVYRYFTIRPGFGSDYYSEKYNLRFYHITKNAMTSVLAVLDCRRIPVNEIPSDAKSFCVIRDPFYRVIAAYEQLCKRVLGNYKDLFGRPTIYDQMPITLHRPLSKQLKSPYRKDIISYERLKKICSRSPEGIRLFLYEIAENGFFESHHYPQVDYLDMKSFLRDGKEIDYFLDFDNLEVGLRKITHKNLKVPRRNKGKFSSDDKIVRLFEPHREKIYRIYAADVYLYQKVKHK